MGYGIAGILVILLAVQQGSLPLETALVLCVPISLLALLIIEFIIVCERSNRKTDSIGKRST